VLFDGGGAKFRSRIFRRYGADHHVEAKLDTRKGRESRDYRKRPTEPRGIHIFEGCGVEFDIEGKV
jgi:hypothetical protein